MQSFSKEAFLITAGGTGGHVLPAVVVAEEILSRGEQVIFVTDPRGQAYVPQAFAVSLYSLPLPSTIGSFLSKLKLAVGLLKSLIQVHRILKSTKIQAVIGFGGYPSFPVLVLSVIYRIPFILHEQNAILGRVNRWFGKSSKAIAISTSAVRFLPPSLNNKIRVTGMPVRKEIQELRSLRYALLEKEQEPVYLTILGGSQGTEVFSRIIPEALSLLPPALQQRLVVTQQCRPTLLEQTQKAYDHQDIKANLATFFETMSEILKKSHVVIARAGASTIAELTWAQRPAILVPYPWAMDNHQKANAEDIERAGGGWMILESDFTPEQLAKKLKALINHPQALLFASERLRTLCRTDAEKRIVDIAVNLKEKVIE